MSPSFPNNRPVWVWSIPAFAILLSFLWYRKKRGSLKTDSGGAGETLNDRKSVECEEDIIPYKSGFEIEESEENRVEVSEIIDRVKVDITVESKPVKIEEEPVVAVAAAEVEAEIEESVKDAASVSDEPEIEAEEETEKDKIEDDKKDNSNIANNQAEETDSKEENTEAGNKIEVGSKEENTEENKVEENTEENKVEENTEENKVEEVEISQVIKDEPPCKNSENKCGKKKRREMAKKSKESSLDQRQNKDENTACILEQKLAKLDLAKQCTSDGTDEKQPNEDEAERDSANNSPSEVMLASPSVSGYSDTHSEGSSDSGKGCSEMLTPSRTPASGNSVSGDLPATSVYEFVIPQNLVGRLIGRHGSYINEIKEATHALIYIKKHPDTPKLKICAIEGTQMDIDGALDMVRRKFPKKRYPAVTLEQVVIAPEPPIIPVLPDNMQLYLVEGINNDVILSSLVSAGHFFLQQPTHPTYLSLNRLNSCMNLCYSEPNQPTIPEGVGAGILCAAPVHNGWYRAQIINMDSSNDVCDVKFVDYGGYMSLPVSALRQIRADFINLPFQAAECYLAGVKPVREDNTWSEEAKESVEKLTFGKVLQAQVYGYADDGVPLIYLYTVFNNQVILLNQELVDRGFAEWVYSEPVTEESEKADEAVEYPEMEETEALAVAV